MGTNTACATVAVTAVSARDYSRDYITQRLEQLYWVLYEKIQEKFESPRPKSLKELKDWLKTGNYRFDVPKNYDEENEDDRYFSWHDCFKFGKEKLDKKARQKLFEKLDEARQVARDIVNVKTDEDARLNALREFEAFAI